MLKVPAAAPAPALAFRMVVSATDDFNGDSLAGVLSAWAAVCRLDSTPFRVPKADSFA